MKLSPLHVLPSLFLAGTLAGALSDTLSAQDRYNVHFRSNRYSGQAGGIVTAALGIDNTPEAITGFSFGVKHDATKLSIQAVTIGPALQAALGAGSSPDERFYSLNQAPAGGAGFTLAIILSADQATIVLPAGLDHHVFDVAYKIADGSSGESRIDLTSDLGSPKVDIILDRNGRAQKPVGPAAVVSATVAVTVGPAPFIRGDATQSGRLDVTDAIILLDYLFGGSSLPAGAPTRDKCLAVFNFDGSIAEGTRGVEDGPDIAITDAIGLLQYVFQRGLAPAAPFPACGQPAAAVDPGIECEDFRC
jgi:hypothetical protein